jgi:hypothetical protein
MLALIMCHSLISSPVASPEDEVLLKEGEKRGFKFLSLKKNLIDISI